MHFYWHTLYSPTCMHVCVFYFYFDCFYVFFTGLLFFVCLFVLFFVFLLFAFCCCCCCQCCVYPHYKWGHSHRKLIIVCPLSQHVPRTCRKAFLLSTHPAYNIYLHSIFTLSNVLVADICLLSNNSVNFSHQSITKITVKQNIGTRLLRAVLKHVPSRKLFQICIVCRFETIRTCKILLWSIKSRTALPTKNHGLSWLIHLYLEMI